MGQFAIRGRSDSANHPPHEKPRKRKKLEKKNHEDKGAVSVQISPLGETKFKNYFSFKQKLEKEVIQLQLLEAKLRENEIDKIEIKNILGIEQFEDISEIFFLIEERKDFLFEKYFEFYDRPLTSIDISLLEFFAKELISQPSLSFHMQTEHLAQEHLKLI